MFFKTKFVDSCVAFSRVSRFVRFSPVSSLSSRVFMLFSCRSLSNLLSVTSFCYPLPSPLFAHRYMLLWMYVCLFCVFLASPLHARVLLSVNHPQNILSFLTRRILCPMYLFHKFPIWFYALPFSRSYVLWAISLIPSVLFYFPFTQGPCSVRHAQRYKFI